MLLSYVKVKDEVQILLVKENELERVNGIDHGLLNELIEFLKPVRKCSKTLSGDKYPTMHLVAVCHNELKDEIYKFIPKSEEMTTLLEQAKHCFEEYVVIMDIHYMACLLDPRYRQLKFADQTKRAEAVEYLKYLVEEQNKTNQRNPPLVPATTAKEKAFRFEKYQDDELSGVALPEVSEVDRYLTHKFDLTNYLDESKKLDICGFWRDMNIFPNVKKVARCILGIPAAETTDERNFSSATQTYTPRRTLLSGESLSELLFIHKSVDAPKLP